MNTPQNLSQLIEFQSGAVVSREIVNQPTGTITLFAFDTGQGLSEHAAPFAALVLAIEGEAEITLSGAANTIKTGQILLMPANSPHSLKAQKPFKMLLVMIKS